ncbi:protein FAR-RED IMPAIRED RESPONSE 1-like [Aegilops tauschii subsp. strangulata]|uniref:protein FAR-RED IMPAIRED RESPONSE 1-like n=1 Tax=Aegilops tauschii subsp. strangulata TaxID=200361 RepID=UPI003CC8448D
MAPPPKNMPVRRPREEEEEVSPLEPPNIEAYVLPRLEMRFETFEEAKDFYNVYAKHADFAVREGPKFKTGAYLYCMCYGVYESKVSEANRQRNKTTARTNCGAKMWLKRKAKNSRMDDVDDVLKTVNFFREMIAINREFFCDMQLDESDRVKNIFWVNASCRGAYQDFGDCVMFDTTYKTNKYQMPLGVFVGTNNHLQTTFFGFALIRDEDADSFRWLFKTFLRYNLHDDATMLGMWNEHEKWISAYFKEIFCAKMTSTQQSESMNYVLKRNFKEQNTLTFYGFDTQMAKVVADPMGETYECECRLWDHTGLFCVHVLCMMQTIKAASVPEKYILKRYTKHPNIQPTFNRNDLQKVASNKASQYCIESSLLMLNMRVHRKSLRSQEQMVR